MKFSARHAHVVFFVASVSLGAPAPQLADTGLYSDFAQKVVSPDVLPYSPQYPLWTDGATKKRWIKLPPGTQVDAADPDHWVFPVGTKFYKEFSFPHTSGTGLKRVETRIVEKTSDTAFEFSTYAWNEDESAALLAPRTGIKDAYPSGLGQTHDIPPVAACMRCHNRGGDRILGFDMLQLSDDRDPMAPHGEAHETGMLSLGELVTRNLLLNPPVNVVPSIHARDSIGRAAMGYLHANCGSCHNPTGNGSFSELFLRHSMEAVDEASEPVFLTTVNQFATGFMIPGENETYRIKAGDPEKSAIVYRLKASGFEKMPPVGTKVPDVEAIALIENWIRGLATSVP